MKPLLLFGSKPPPPPLLAIKILEYRSVLSQVLAMGLHSTFVQLMLCLLSSSNAALLTGLEWEALRYHRYCSLILCQGSVSSEVQQASFNLDKVKLLHHTLPSILLMPVWISTKSDNHFLAKFRTHFILHWLGKFSHPMFKFKMVWRILRIRLDAYLQ